MATAVQSGFSFDPVAHVYTQDGAPIISVTQAIGLAGLVSFAGINPAVLERKAQLGTLVHQAIQFHHEGDLDYDALPGEVQEYFAGYLTFLSDTGFVAELSEYRQVAAVNGLKYGMTLDMTGQLNSVPHILDFKCGAEESPAWGVQLAAYEMALPRPLPYRHYERAVVQLGPQFARGYKIHSYADPSDAQIWLACLAVATWKLNHNLH